MVIPVDLIDALYELMIESPYTIAVQCWRLVSLLESYETSN